MGFQQDKSTIDQQISALAVEWRELAEKSVHLLKQCQVTGNVHTYLVAAGYDNTPNANNPGGISDASQAENFVDYMGASLAGLYFGTQNQPAAFAYNDALAPAWNGRL